MKGKEEIDLEALAALEDLEARLEKREASRSAPLPEIPPEPSLPAPFEEEPEDPVARAVRRHRREKMAEARALQVSEQKAKLAKKEKSAPRPRSWRELDSSDLHIVGMGLGLWILTLMPLWTGLQIARHIWSHPGAPGWIFPFVPLLLGLACLPGSFFPILLVEEDSPPRHKRRRRWLSTWILRIGLGLVLPNILLAAYGAPLGAAGRLRASTFVWLVASSSAVSLFFVLPRRTRSARRKELGETELLRLEAAAGTQASCPFCATPIGTDPWVACASCETLHHPDCWEENGSCSIYACGETVFLDQTGRAPARLAY